jgi:hypothetical protein
MTFETYNEFILFLCKGDEFKSEPVIIAGEYFETATAAVIKKVEGELKNANK